MDFSGKKTLNLRQRSVIENETIGKSLSFETLMKPFGPHLAEKSIYVIYLLTQYFAMWAAAEALGLC